MSSPGPLARLLAPAAAALLLVHALWSTPFREDVAVAFRAQTFAERRVAQAFVGTDMAAVEARLATLIGAAPVALAPSIEEQELFRQRFREALYPREIRADAANTVVPYRRGAMVPRRVIGVLGDYDLALVGPLPEPAPEPVAPRAPAAPLAASGFLVVSLLAWVGLGLGVFGVRRAWQREPEGVPVHQAACAGLLASALAWSVATWVGLALPPPLLVVAGLVAFAALARRGLRWTAPSPWALVPALVVGLLAARLVAAPIARWDGRSIWLFHARRIWEHGRFLASEAAAPDTLFSHPDYPLAWPAALAFPSGLAGVFDERLAGVGAALALAFVAALAFRMAREALGAPAAAGLVAALVVHVTRATAGGYAEGLLVLTLLAAFLALRAGRTTIGALALALAALTKVEGLPLGLLVGAAGTLAGPAPRAHAWRGLVAFVPALAHVAWTRAHGLDSLLKGGSVGSSLGALGARWSEVLARAPSLLDAPGDTGVRAILVPGLIGTGVTALALARPAARRDALCALAVVLGGAALATGAIAALPETVEWFVATALDRLLLHASAFALLGALLALSAASPGSAASAPPPPSAAAGSPPAPAS